MAGTTQRISDDHLFVKRSQPPSVPQIECRADGSNRLKLGDFGLAMVVTEPIFTVCGTPTYVAPEILSETGE